MKDLKPYKTVYAIRFVYKDDGDIYEYLDRDLFESEEIAKESALDIWDKIKGPGEFLQSFHTVPFYFYQ